MIIPGEYIALVTFPGVVIHEIAHRFFCDIFRVPVYEVCYFAPFSSTSGCVVHQPTESLKANFFIAMGPLFINSIVCMICTFPFRAALSLTGGLCEGTSLEWFLLWIGISAGMHALPSHVDIDYLKERFTKDLPEHFLFIFPIIVLYILKGLNYLRVIWIDLFYALGMSCLLPAILL